MKKNEPKTTSKAQASTDSKNGFEGEIHSLIANHISMARGFKAPVFPAESIEAKRPDQAELSLAAEKAARHVVSIGDRLLSPDKGSEDLQELAASVFAFSTALRALHSFESLAWLELLIKLEEAKADEKIKFNQEVVRFIDLMIDLIKPARGNWDIERALKPLNDQIKSKHASLVAAKKNATPRAWVQQQWRDRVDQGQSKAAFARQHAQLVKQKFGLDVTAETIKTTWLPKG